MCMSYFVYRKLYSKLSFGELKIIRKRLSFLLCIIMMFLVIRLVSSWLFHSLKNIQENTEIKTPQIKQILLTEAILYLFYFIFTEFIPIFIVTYGIYQSIEWINEINPRNKKETSNTSSE